MEAEPLSGFPLCSTYLKWLLFTLNKIGGQKYAFTYGDKEYSIVGARGGP